jgi:[ribosomal protein S5]-alanine N-acetyltransferase
MLESERLIILPLIYEQVELYLSGNAAFEKSLNLRDTGRIVSAEVKEMVTRFTLTKMKAAPGDNYLFYTFWIVVEKASNIIVAELGFKGEPSKNGEIEIGYGSMHNYRRKGFMTEAVSAIVRWAAERSDVRGVLAETDQENIASQRILEKNNFRIIKRKNNMIWWKIALK